MTHFIQKMKKLTELIDTYGERAREIHEMYLSNSTQSKGYDQNYYSQETELEAITKTNRYYKIFGSNLIRISVNHTQ